MEKIILTGGGTAGHCVPNLAIARELEKYDFESVYIGSHEGIEKSLATGAGLRYYGISTGKLRRYFDWKNFTDPFRVIKGLSDAWSILKKEKPSLVFSKGGFVSVPVVKAASALHIPVIIHESDMTPGLANKLSYGSAVKICCSFRETCELLPPQKAVFTGSPIRASISEGDRDRARAFTALRGGYPSIMVMGGSLGAQRVNEQIRRVLPQLLKSYNVIHLCGKGKVDATLQYMDGYVQYDYIDRELPDLYALSDMVISRAGANSIFELLYLKKPNLLIPLSASASRGDQILNARSFSRAGYSHVLEEENMDDVTILEAIDEVMEHSADYTAAMEKAVESSAVLIIRDLILETVKGQDGRRQSRKQN